MIPTYSLRLIFPNSRSKDFKQAIQLAGEFNDFQKGEKTNIVSISMREVFEKWEFFNLLFWRTVKWKGTILEWERMEFHSHTDKTRIFYALQHAHVSYICFLEDKIRQLYKIPFGEIKYEELDKNVYTEADMDLLIDTFQILQRKKQVTVDESLEGIKVRERPHFLQNDKQFGIK